MCIASVVDLPIFQFRFLCNSVMSLYGVRPYRSDKLPSRPMPTKFSDDPAFDYTLEQELGRGRFAKVCEARHNASGLVYAAKISRRWRNGGDKKDEILREMEILNLAVNIRHIVNVHDYYVDLKNVILFLERATGGDLYQLVSDSLVSPPETYVKTALRQLLEAVTFLHSNCIVHLDIKPENILLRKPYPDCDIVLCDFGLSKYLNSSDTVRELVGTPDYVAPEVLNYDPIHFETDLWSVGVLTYYLLTGISPFWSSTKESTLNKVCQVDIEYPDDVFEDHSPDALKFIQTLIRRKPSDRPSAAECLVAPWLTFSDDSVEGGKSISGDSLAPPSQRVDLDRSCGECSFQ